jgi:hypothetical protein
LNASIEKKITIANYDEVCHELGFIPEARFIKIGPHGSIGFTVSKPNEITALYDAASCAGYAISRGLSHARARIIR